MRIPVEDSLKERDFELMHKFLPAAVEFIHKHADIQKENVFIHCYAGRQRSISCLAGYLMCKHKMTPHQACLYALKRRPEAFHHGLSLNFSKSLSKYYKDLKNHNLTA
jgi:protein-tyrosine phosphatase